MIRQISLKFDFLISSTLCVTVSLTLIGQALAQEFPCEDLRPIRGSELAIEGDFQAEAGFIARKIIGGDVDLSGKYKLKEVFPEVFDGQDLFEIERFYYTLCLALSDPRIDPERRFAMFLQANRERQFSLREAFNEQISSGDPQKQIEAINWAEEKGGSVQAQAIETGLQSDSALVQAAAVEAAVGTSDVISGTVIGGDATSTGSFSIVVSKRTKVGNATNFVGTFQGGIFTNSEQLQEAHGSLRGNTLNVSNEACSLSATVATDRPLLEGTLSCTPYISIAKYPKTGRVIIPLY